ncbi:hypothetical protein PoB_004903800 [Plakobranchus ocellatus]|uniref:Uncharacterized protein n=1 Tax=Plakobranchus ocellatus TaxID=259542 RepID=A0AAV4BTK6_9GAST|nr:hypothetical protein PoB_004903800 [Plakobranchus ocellatus]
MRRELLVRDLRPGRYILTAEVRPALQCIRVPESLLCPGTDLGSDSKTFCCESRSRSSPSQFPVLTLYLIPINNGRKAKAAMRAEKPETAAEIFQSALEFLNQKLPDPISQANDSQTSDCDMNDAMKALTERVYALEKQIQPEVQKICSSVEVKVGACADAMSSNVKHQLNRKLDDLETKVKALDSEARENLIIDLVAAAEVNPPPTGASALAKERQLKDVRQTENFNTEAPTNQRKSEPLFPWFPLPPKKQVSRQETSRWPMELRQNTNFNTNAPTDLYIPKILDVKLLPGPRLLQADCRNDCIKLFDTKGQHLDTLHCRSSPLSLAVLNNACILKCLPIAVTLPKSLSIDILEIINDKIIKKRTLQTSRGYDAVASVNKDNIAVGYWRDPGIDIIDLEGRILRQILIRLEATEGTRPKLYQDCEALNNAPTPPTDSGSQTVNVKRSSNRTGRIDPQTFGQSLDTDRSTHGSAIGQSLDPKRSTHHSASPAETSSSAADILKDFERLRDSLVRIPVPNNFKVNHTTTGIKQDCRGTLRVLSKWARFAETGLKVLTTLPDERDSSSVSIQREDLESIFVVFAAQINFLQSEYAGLVVKSTLNDETSRIFRSFENNASSFSRQSLQNVRIAAELASIHGRTNTASQSWRGRRRGVANQTRGSYSSFPLNRRRYDNNDMRSNTFTRPPTVREDEA